MTKKIPQNTNFTIRNSTAEFLMFTVDSCVDNISFHLKNIVKDHELDKNSVIKKFSVTASDLDLAEERAKRKIPMTMEDWSKRLDKFLEFDDRNILKTKEVSHTKKLSSLQRLNGNNIAFCKISCLSLILIMRLKKNYRIIHKPCPHSTNQT